MKTLPLSKVGHKAPKVNRTEVYVFQERSYKMFKKFVSHFPRYKFTLIDKLFFNVPYQDEFQEDG